MTPPSFTPLNSSAPDPPNAALDPARNAGFSPLGRFRYKDTGSDRKQLLTLALSPDHLTLVILRGKGGTRVKLMTRFLSTRWLVTSNFGGIPDFTGLELQEMLPDTTFDVLLSYHLAQLRSFAESPLPFESSLVTKVLIEHDRQQTEQLVKAGFACYKSSDHSIAKFTVFGALRMTLATVANLRTVRRQAALATARQQQAEWGLTKSPDRFLVTAPPPPSLPPKSMSLPPPAPLPQSSAISQIPSASPAPPSSQSSDIPPPV